ncbi:MAG: hypothetical protein AB1424_09610 [Thermodesulfobacteriota bacterium]
MAHHAEHHSEEAMPAYRKKQGLLCILVFLCIGVAFWSGSAAVAVLSIMAACGICFWAASLEPERAPDEHHH